MEKVKRSDDFRNNVRDKKLVEYEFVVIIITVSLKQ